LPLLIFLRYIKFVLTLPFCGLLVQIVKKKWSNIQTSRLI